MKLELTKKSARKAFEISYQISTHGKTKIFEFDIIKIYTVKYSILNCYL